MEEFYTWFVEYVNVCKVRVCMGGFNMAMFGIVAARRSRGLTLDVVAWNGRETFGCKPGAVSTAILFFNTPGIYKPKNGLDVLHDRSGGFLAEEATDDYLLFDCENEPGHLLDDYLPETVGFEGKLHDFVLHLTRPSPQSQISTRRWR